MLKTFKTSLSAFRRDEDGATLVEYGIALTLAILVGGTALTQLGNDVSASMTSASGALPAQAAAPAAGG